MQRNIQKAYILTNTNPHDIQINSSNAFRAVSDMIKTCLGPHAMQKMVLTKNNTVEITNDGNAILRELDTAHPSARCLIDLSRTQDDECGDGTTSVIILTAEIFTKIVPLLKTHHPNKINKILNKAKNICMGALESISTTIGEDKIINVVKSSVSTKLCSMLKLPFPEIALIAANFNKQVGDD